MGNRKGKTAVIIQTLRDKGMTDMKPIETNQLGDQFNS
jgi:hypothetical protein